MHFSLGVEAAKVEDGDLFCYRETQTRLHAEWRSLSEMSKQWYHKKADEGYSTAKRALRTPKRVPHATEAEADPDATATRSPWQLGSISRPCSTETLKKAVGNLLPDGKHWLRNAYAKALEITDASSGACPYVDSSEHLPLNSASKARLSQQACCQRMPGLCASNKDFQKIKRFRARLTEVVNRFTKNKASCHGELLLGFGVGGGDGARADAHPMVAGGICEFAFLAGEPDKRKGWKVFTSCKPGGRVRCDELSFPFKIRLEASPEGTFVEMTDYMMAVRFFCAASRGGILECLWPHLP